MARQESVSSGGFFAAPVELLPLIAQLVTVEPHKDRYGAQIILDPCAGEGEAVYTLADAWSPDQLVNVITFEMEASRHEQLSHRVDTRRTWGRDKAYHSNAFQLKFTQYNVEGVSVLYLNPPYDTDQGRVESKFLDRFVPLLAPEGALLFVVPFDVLGSCKATLASWFDDLACYRFPGAHFDAYRQVVLIGTKRHRAAERPEIEALITAWGLDKELIPELTEGLPSRHVHVGRPGLEVHRVELDVLGILAGSQPWGFTDKMGKNQQVEGLVPWGSATDLLQRHYPIAMPPKAAHIATGIAAGIFNGVVIEGDDPSLHLPRFLVKGSFDKEWRVESQKTDKKTGQVVGVIEVQAPKLMVNVLDLDRKVYYPLNGSTELTLSRDPATMTMADLIHYYGKDLMGSLLKQCPVLHDPADPGQAFPLPEMGRTLFTAQAHAVRAAVKLLGGMNAKRSERAGKVAYILGQIGVGKTTMAIATCRAINAKTILLMCPPQLPDMWAEEIHAVLPDATVTVINDVEDLERFARDPQGGNIRFAIVTRDMAKLGHAYEGVPAMCPKCHAPVPAGDLGKKRARCGASRRTAIEPFGQFAVELAKRLYLICPEHDGVYSMLPYAIGRRKTFKPIVKEHKARAISLLLGEIDGLLSKVMDHLESQGQEWLSSYAVLATEMFDAILPLVQSDSLRLDFSKRVYAWPQSHASHARRTARSLSCLLSDTSFKDFCTFLEQPERKDLYRGYSQNQTEIGGMVEARTNRLEGRPITHGMNNAAWGDFSDWKHQDGKDHFKGDVPKSFQAVNALYQMLVKNAEWAEEKPCCEYLFQAVPVPTRRVALAKRISQKYPWLFDAFIGDEIHEWAGASAQGMAGHRLMNGPWPSILLTGTVSNGYASSLFENFWADGSLRTEFGKEDMTLFIERYGYKRRQLEDRDQQTGKVVEFGVYTDKVQSARVTGQAPGVLPLFEYRYLLPKAAVVHREDLGIEQPPLIETRVDIVPSAEQMAAYKALESALITQMRKDMFSERTGTLFGALTELPSYLDRCTRDVGNQPTHDYEIRYPEEFNRTLVALGESFDPEYLLPKEAWMVEVMKDRLEKGKNVMVCGWHRELFPRLVRIIEKHVGIKVPYLQADRVAPAKRQVWIDTNVRKKDARALVVNPMAVQTGLNNLTHFSTMIFMENPACNPIMYRQSVGRIDRLGQKDQPEVLFPIYKGTLQETLHRLLFVKIAVSRSIDGLDGEGAMQAAGIGSQNTMSTLTVGKALAEWMRQREEAGVSVYE